MTLFCLAPLDRAAAQIGPDFSFTKTASPTTYTQAGQVITYDYVLTNTGDQILNNVGVTDDRVPVVTCSSSSFAPTETITCTGSYTITSADIAAGSVTNTATASAEGDPDIVVRQAQATVTFAGGPPPPPPSQNSSITIIKEAVAGSGTFTFVSSTAALAFSLTTGGTASSGRIALPPGTYSIRELQNNQFFYLSEIACNDPDGGTQINQSNSTATIDLDAGEHITCTFTNVDPRPQTQAVIERFLYHRLTALLDDDPDRPRFLRRFPGSLWGGGPGGDGSPFNVTASENGSNVAFSTSLSQMRQAVASADSKLDDRAMSLGSAALYERPGPAPYQGIDIWTEGHFTSYDDTGGASGNFDVLYVGADYPLTDNILVGVLGQFDWADEHTKADGSRIDGDGWMAGPYVSARLDEHLFFDWRAAWGTSDNSVSPFGTYTDNFDTDRWLTTARLTGNWTSGNWRLTPSVAVKYGEENQDGYTDSNGIRISGQDVSLGRVEFGPEFGYRWLLSGGTLVEPQLSLVGVWNFDDSGRLVVNNTFFTPDDFTGRVEGGMLVYLPSGWSFRGAAAYDGIGSDYEAVTGKVWLNVPLN
ncbi:MAG: autotransporter domain-containing protein [Methyloceanibacter sp.]|uniref:autotransporter family protein n=1 Tax=Methyloceanibacter sp. TaxID=1965321 RepID=UPI003D6D3F9A